MFEYIKGRLTAAMPNKAIVDIQGLGYGILIALNTYGRLPQIGEEVLLYLSPVVREDSNQLFGFLTLAERELFEKFTTVSGIGPKTGLALIGHMDIEDLQLAIMQGNIALLSKAPGIGKKTAERLIIEMRDKLSHSKTVAIPGLSATSSGSMMTDAISALINLGYHPMNAQKAVKSAVEASKEELDLGRLITLSLKKM
jgi:Holliday junction DNA helicase RuvA